MRRLARIPFIPSMTAAALALVPSLALAATPRTLQELAAQIVVILGNATTVLIVAGIAIYFYGISINILKFGEKGAEKLKAYFLWGIIVLFVMVSVWGIIGLVRNTIFGNDQYSPTTGAPTQNAAFPVYGQ